MWRSTSRLAAGLRWYIGALLVTQSCGLLNPSADRLQDNCVCQCCTADTCETTGPIPYTFNAVYDGDCSEAHCSARFYQCPDVGSHNDGGQVTASYKDCTCDVPVEYRGRSELKPMAMYAGHPELCTVERCEDRFLDEFIAIAADVKNLTASYTGEQFTSGDCSCGCCNSELTCPDLRVQTWHVGTSDKCTVQSCSARFYLCPDAGAHNSAFVNIPLFTGYDVHGGTTGGGGMGKRDVGIVVGVSLVAVVVILAGVFLIVHRHRRTNVYKKHVDMYVQTEEWVNAMDVPKHNNAAV